MAWRIDFEDKAKGDLAALDKPIARRIIKFLRERVAPLEDPRSIGEALKGSRLGGFWKYRVGVYRLICDIEDDQVRVLVVRVGHRSAVYKPKR